MHCAAKERSLVINGVHRYTRQKPILLICTFESHTWTSLRAWWNIHVSDVDSGRCLLVLLGIRIVLNWNEQTWVPLPRWMLFIDIPPCLPRCCCCPAQQCNWHTQQKFDARQCLIGMTKDFFFLPLPQQLYRQVSRYVCMCTQKPMGSVISICINIKHRDFKKLQSNVSSRSGACTIILLLSVPGGRLAVRLWQRLDGDKVPMRIESNGWSAYLKPLPMASCRTLSPFLTPMRLSTLARM